MSSDDLVGSIKRHEIEGPLKDIRFLGPSKDMRFHEGKHKNWSIKEHENSVSNLLGSINAP